MAKQTFTTGSVLTATQMNNLQANDYNWTVDGKVASYVLVAADAGKRIEMNSGSATTITVNTGLFTAGDMVYLSNIGAGVCTVTAGTATVNKATNASLALSQYQSGMLYFVSASSAIFYPFDIGTGAGGSLTSLATGSLSGASVTINPISGSYNSLRLVLKNHYLSADGQTQITVNNTTGIYTNGTTNTFLGAGSIAMTQTLITTNPDLNSDNRAANQIVVMDIFEYAGSSHKIGSILTNEGNTDGTGWNTVRCLFGIRTTSAISRIDIAASTGNFTAGTYTLYGVN